MRDRDMQQLCIVLVRGHLEVIAGSASVFSNIIDWHPSQLARPYNHASYRHQHVVLD